MRTWPIQQSNSELRSWHHYWWSPHDNSLPGLNTTFPNERRKTRVTGHSVPTEKTICPFRNISRSTVSARRSRMSSTQPWRLKRPNRSRSWYATPGTRDQQKLGSCSISRHHASLHSFLGSSSSYKYHKSPWNLLLHSRERFFRHLVVISQALFIGVLL